VEAGTLVPGVVGVWLLGGKMEAGPAGDRQGQCDTRDGPELNPGNAYY
jgi:hypothetical protein